MREEIANGERRRIVQRRYAPKTRTGCTTCKIRRVKCDEAKPFCQRCVTTGRKCDGYAPPTPSPDKSPTSDSLTVALSADLPCDALERRTFDFFRSRTAPCVSGYFQDSVWDRYVLQASHSEPTIRYAVNALGALHEEKSLIRSARNEGLGSPLKTDFPLRQYAKALNGLQSLLCSENPHIDLILMSVLLLVHFEALRERFVPAIMHIENAIRLLHSSTTFDARKVDPGLVRSMVRMDIQGSMYLGMRVPGLPFYTASTDSDLPVTFRDLTQARDFVNTWTCRLFHFMRLEGDPHKFREVGDLPLESIAKSHEFVQTFVDLDRLLWDFLHKPSSRMTIREQHGLGMLRSRVKINRILAATCLYTEATMFDMFDQEFQDILTICNHIMESDAADRRLFSVSLDEGLVHPLFFVATHCRDSSVRRAALTQLDKLPAKHGIWHIEAMIRTAELCVKFEESCSDKETPTYFDIPEWRRIHSAGFDAFEMRFSREKVTTHLSIRPNGMDGEWHDISEMIECCDSYVPADFAALFVSSFRSGQPTGAQRTITWP